MTTSIVILAAGKGTRMRSTKPKVLQHLAGEPLLAHVLNTATQLSAQPPIVVVGHEQAEVRQALQHFTVTWVEQAEQLGTGHAVQQALPKLVGSQVLVLYGDVPLISLATLQTLLSNTPPDALGILTAHVKDPFGLGRILRDSTGDITGIVEEKDASPAQRQIVEINTGIYVIPRTFLETVLPHLKNANSQKEYYLTDIVAAAAKAHLPIVSITPAANTEILGVNNRQQLALLERHFQLAKANALMAEGVTLIDPNRFDIRGNLTVGSDTIIDINVITIGDVRIGNGCYIGPNTIIENSTIGNHVEIRANSMLDSSHISDQCVIGPFARLRPGTELAAEAHIGNFVEVKKSRIGAKTKISHLSYIGDSDIGREVNIGAGTITCNYDGVHKHKTVIGDRAFIGSDTQLVAPVTVGADATIGAGSTITRDAPAQQLTLSRAPQRSIANWARPLKEEG